MSRGCLKPPKHTGEAAECVAAILCAQRAIEEMGFDSCAIFFVAKWTKVDAKKYRCQGFTRITPALLRALQSADETEKKFEIVQIYCILAT